MFLDRRTRIGISSCEPLGPKIDNDLNLFAVPTPPRQVPFRDLYVPSCSSRRWISAATSWKVRCLAFEVVPRRDVLGKIIL